MSQSCGCPRSLSWAPVRRHPTGADARGASRRSPLHGALSSYRAARAGATPRPIARRSPKARRLWRFSAAAATASTRQKMLRSSSRLSMAGALSSPSATGRSRRCRTHSEQETASSQVSLRQRSSSRRGCRRAPSPPPMRRRGDSGRAFGDGKASRHCERVRACRR